MKMIQGQEFRTEQEQFWAGEFGNAYIERNDSEGLVASNIAMFSAALRNTSGIRNYIEFGANIGLNLRALRTLLPQAEQSAIEINPTAASRLADILPPQEIYNQSILEFSPSRQWDLTLIKGVLIHINPDYLPEVYEKLYSASRKYILVCEYYNPTPVTVTYRGHEDRLFKRDFCGEMLERYRDLRLCDYGFVYKRDVNFPQDDLTWFLMEKTA